MKKGGRKHGVSKNIGAEPKSGASCEVAVTLPKLSEGALEKAWHGCLSLRACVKWFKGKPKRKPKKWPGTLDTL